VVDLGDAQERERTYENAMAGRYNRDYHEPPLMGWHSENFVKYVSRHYVSGDRVLDLGCGPASLWEHFRGELANPGALVGVDLSDGMIDEAKRLCPDGDFRVGSMFSIPAGAGEFDVVVVSSAFHHVPDESLPLALKEIHRVLDEHGKLIGREPLARGRVGDRGGYLADALMHLRHLAYRLTHTREYPEPQIGPVHHAYEPKEFTELIGRAFTLVEVEFRNPLSLFLARIKHPTAVAIGKLLDEAVGHKEGQEIHYLAAKNYSSAADVKYAVRRALEENRLDDIPAVLALVEAAAMRIEAELGSREEG
jgi:ubiquinone/menaquinone biosynthesis C-methylase UbiE